MFRGFFLDAGPNCGFVHNSQDELRVRVSRRVQYRACNWNTAEDDAEQCSKHREQTEVATKVGKIRGTYQVKSLDTQRGNDKEPIARLIESSNLYITQMRLANHQVKAYRKPMPSFSRAYPVKGGVARIARSMRSPKTLRRKYDRT